MTQTTSDSRREKGQDAEHYTPPMKRLWAEGPGYAETSSQHSSSGTEERGHALEEELTNLQHRIESMLVEMPHYICTDVVHGWSKILP